MSVKRVQRYKGFTLEITYLPTYPEADVFAERQEYPALAFYERDVKAAQARIDQYWKERNEGRK